MVDGHIVNALVFVSLFCALSALPSATPSFSQIPSEDWNYVKVRENAFGYSYVTDKTAFTTNVTGKRRIYMIVYFFAIIVHRYNLMVFSFVFVRIYYVAILYLGYNSVLLMGLMENGL